MIPGGFLQFFNQWKRERMLYGGVTSPHYLVKLYPLKQRILKSVVTVFHYPTEDCVCVSDK